MVHLNISFVRDVSPHIILGEIKIENVWNTVSILNKLPVLILYITIFTFSE